VIVATTASKTQSAGLLLFRHAADDTRVLLGHPGGPFWRRKDVGAWSIPKGLIAPGETPLAAAKREFAEETGHHPRGETIPLGNASSRAAKLFTSGLLSGHLMRLISRSPQSKRDNNA
jgi:predicted NUDIX family NTP pyrophosphohydrolase